MAAGQFVRLMLPRKRQGDHRTDTIIVGQVVHSHTEAGRSVIGVAFGWDADFTGNSQASGARNSNGLWFQILSGTAKRLRLVIARGWRAILNQETALPVVLPPRATAGGGRSRCPQKPTSSRIVRAR